MRQDGKIHGKLLNSQVLGILHHRNGNALLYRGTRYESAWDKVFGMISYTENR